MCLLCATRLGDQERARRANVLQLLALIEHPDALPANVALRLAREVLALAQIDRTERRCEPVGPPEPAIEEVR
jgi:hypothetical protein